MKRSYADVIVEALREDIGHERDLLVVPGAGADAGGGAHRGARAVGCDRELRLDHGRAFLAFDPLAMACERHARHTRGRDDLDGFLSEARPQRCTHDAIHDDVAERFQPLLSRVDAGEAEAALIGNVDAMNRRRVALDERPDA